MVQSEEIHGSVGTPPLIQTLFLGMTLFQLFGVPRLIQIDRIECRGSNVEPLRVKGSKKKLPKYLVCCCCQCRS